MTSRERARNHADELGAALVGKVMTRGILSCAADADIAEMATSMSAGRVHCVFVDVAERADADDARWAVVSDLDLIAAAAAGGGRAGRIAGSPTVTVKETDTLLHAAELMRDYQTAHLVVLDGDEVPVGVLSTLDVAGALAEPW